MNIYPLPNGDIELADFPARRSDDWSNCVWMITRQCNLGCPYCIGFKDKGAAKSILDTMSVTEVIDSFERIRDKSGKNIYITITGGEPTLLKKLNTLCRRLIRKKFKIELQSNMVTKNGIKSFIDSVPKHGIGQIMATYHGWALDNKIPKYRKNYIENYNYAMDKGVTCIFKIIVTPQEVFTMRKKLRNMGKVLHKDHVFLPWPFIRGVPKAPGKFNGIYPYAYTKKEHKELNRICKTRREAQIGYRKGAGFFQRMPCDAGNGFFVVTWDGWASRCYSLRKMQRIGNLCKKSVELTGKPTPCPKRFCGTSFWALWFGTEPWKYIPGLDKNQAYYCKFGPEWKS